MQVRLVDPAEGPQVGPQCRAGAFTGVAMDFASTITIMIARPFANPVANRGMGRVTPAVALPFVRVQLRPVSRNGFGDERLARPPVRVVTHPKTLLACLARDDAKDGGAIIGEGAMAFVLIGPSAWRVVRGAMGRAFFPRRFGTIHPPRRRCQA
jgi:hypothetical protein